MHHMITTLRLRQFADSLCTKPVVSLNELRQTVAKFMQLKKLKECRAEASGDEGKEKENERHNRPTAGQRDKHRDNRGYRFTRYTPLSADMGRILDEALSFNLIPPPRRVTSPQPAD